MSIDPGTAAPLAPNFGGYNPDFQVVGMNFADPQAASLARELRAGTLRYPSGTDSDYFDLRSGDVRPEWAAQFFGKMTAFDTSQDDAHIIGAKPDLHRLAGYKALLDDVQADTVIIINGFTDTPESAAAVAGYCLANNIRVAAFELSNEGWLLPTFFMDATDYATRMKPYYDAIKAVDPAAQVNVMFSQGEAPAWDQALGTYPDKYWDGISFHMYGGGDRYSTFDDAVKDLNTRLADRTNSYIDSYYLAKGRPDMRVFVSEFNSTPSTMTALSTSGIIRTLYNGIFAAEFVTRLSAHQNVDRVMLHGLVQFGTTFTKPYLDTMKSVYERGETLDTMRLRVRDRQTRLCAGPRRVPRRDQSEFTHSRHLHFRGCRDRAEAWWNSSGRAHAGVCRTRRIRLARDHEQVGHRAFAHSPVGRRDAARSVRHPVHKLGRPPCREHSRRAGLHRHDRGKRIRRRGGAGCTAL